MTEDATHVPQMGCRPSFPSLKYIPSVPLNLQETVKASALYPRRRQDVQTHRLSDSMSLAHEWL